jgi:acylaminoacyl-peptidase
MLLMQGYCILAINYRGSTGYGEDSMNSLLGTIGVNDVEDCGELTLSALDKYSDVIDPARVGVEGGSHGGFLTGWLTGHPKYKHIWSAACLWNAVLNMSYMLAATDIPDWISGCT